MVKIQFCCEKMMHEMSMNQIMPTPFIYNSVFREYAITIPQSLEAVRKLIDL